MTEQFTTSLLQSEVSGKRPAPPAPGLHVGPTAAHQPRPAERGARAAAARPRRAPCSPIHARLARGPEAVAAPPWPDVYAIVRLIRLRSLGVSRRIRLFRPGPPRGRNWLAQRLAALADSRHPLEPPWRGSLFAQPLARIFCQ